MNLGPLSSYPLPSAVNSAYGVKPAQELVDQLGITKQPTADLGPRADAAFQSQRRGDQAPARTLLVDDLGVSESKADEALARLPKL
ncbi:hypothetical protein [Subtercola boreus]|uniref:Uncharacterized protein n=1 Tax=Subtercola boreus TaxID=120213 RepID=A0A3E0WEI9_9MICO|nr:hypothetical protein [Subtercola boreus]RFA22523.1 hypothetical protein B7R24_02550 [Subtercola boreus]RFA22879.1 hypothetical protein B7R23_02545 [Subtercola boreus]RFA28631.1 hypothetical protein B7R25_02560 [Subtercola boreus]